MDDKISITMVMVAERVIISKLLLFYKTLKDKNISS
jgi:hypothetical protein